MLPSGATLYCVFDCCHSGTVLDLRYCFDERSYSFVEDVSEQPTTADVFLITGCMSAQTSADLPPGHKQTGLAKSVGALTAALMQQLDRRLRCALSV